MDTQALKLARQLAANNMPDRLNWGEVTLSVTDLDRAERFWMDVLGFRSRSTDGPGRALGTADRTLVVLQPGASKPVAKGFAGLYHVAFGMPNQREFSRRLERLQDLRIPHYPVDHLMSKAIYLSDPDGHGIEIAYETPERFGRFIYDGIGFALVDADGRIHSGHERLDIRNELSLADGTDPAIPLQGAAFIAHLHLHVPNLTSALDWFEKIGFARNLTLPEVGIADMGTGSYYTHRLAMNLWAGTDILPAPSETARILSYELVINDREIFDGARYSLVRNPETDILTGSDPAGVSLTLRFQSSSMKTTEFAA